MSSFFGRRRPRQRRPFGVMVEIDGWAMNLAASDADGPILVTARDGTDTVLIGGPICPDRCSGVVALQAASISPASVKMAQSGSLIVTVLR